MRWSILPKPNPTQASGIVGGVSQGAASAARAFSADGGVFGSGGSGGGGGGGGAGGAGTGSSADIGGGGGRPAVEEDAFGGSFGSGGSGSGSGGSAGSSGGGAAAGTPSQRRRAPRALYGAALALRAFDAGDAAMMQALRLACDPSVRRELARFPLAQRASARLARGARLLLLPGHIVRLEGGGGGGGGEYAAMLTPSLLRPLRDVAALEPAVEGGRGVLLLLHLRSQEREERLELERWDGAERVVAAFFDGEP